MTQRREAALGGVSASANLRKWSLRGQRAWPPRQPSRVADPWSRRTLTLISMPTSSSLTARLSTVKGAKGWSAAVAA